MRSSLELKLLACVVGAVTVFGFANASPGQNPAQGQNAGRGQAPPDPNRYPWDHPTVIFEGRPYTERSISARMDTPVGDRTAIPPHKIIGNLYYVGTQTLGSYLFSTPQGLILLNSTFEYNVKPVIQKSIEQLGFKFSDVKILIGNHAHLDHQEGDALVKEMTGAQVMVMAEDADLLKSLKGPSGKEHPIDKIFHDGDSISLGGTTLVAHLTPGHSHGATTYTTTITDGGKAYNVVLFTSFRLRTPYSTGPEVLEAAMVAEFNRSFKWVSTLKCDIPLGDHTAWFEQEAKYEKYKAGGPNPYIDPEGCRGPAHLNEAMLYAVLAEIKANPALAIRPLRPHHSDKLRASSGCFPRS